MTVEHHTGHGEDVERLDVPSNGSEANGGGATGGQGGCCKKRGTKKEACAALRWKRNAREKEAGEKVEGSAMWVFLE